MKKYFCFLNHNLLWIYSTFFSSRNQFEHNERSWLNQFSHCFCCDCSFGGSTCIQRDCKSFIGAWKFSSTWLYVCDSVDVLFAQKFLFVREKQKLVFYLNSKVTVSRDLSNAVKQNWFIRWNSWKFAPQIRSLSFNSKKSLLKSSESAEINKLFKRKFIKC